MLVELLQPLGPELARRWVAALMMVARDEREAMVAAIERRIVELYGPGAGRRPTPAGETRELRVVQPPVQRDGYVEQVEATYEVVTPKARRASGPKGRRAR